MSEKRAGVRELKSNLSEYLRRVEKGEIITITKRGKTIGRIVPESASLKERLEALIDAGFLQWGGKKLTPWTPEMVNKGPGLVSDLVSEDRNVNHLF